jgi:hypothetical protein
MVRVRRSSATTRCLGMILAFVAPAAAHTQSSPRPEAAAPQADDRADSIGRKAGEIATQPARDVGIVEVEIPPVLQAATRGPYSLNGVATCAQISANIKQLTEVLGPDFSTSQTTRENRAGKVAEAGGKTIVNAIIPFRGLVRELTGAAPAQRRLNAAIDAGHARRGFLHGLHQTRRCRTAF